MLVGNGSILRCVGHLLQAGRTEMNERDDYRQRFEACIREHREEYMELRKQRRPGIRERIAALLGVKRTEAKPLVVAPKRAGGAEVCSSCGEWMIAGSGPLHRPLLCGECK